MARRPRARLADVAAQAGVTAQTVSNVINGRGRFSDATRDRVLSAAEELGFSRNRLALRLRTRRSGHIGLHIPREQLGIRDNFTYSFMLAIIDAAESRGLQIVVLTHPLDAETVAESDVDGFILCNHDPADGRSELLAAEDIPFAIFGRLAEHLPQTWVDIDNILAMEQVIDRLVETGCRTMAYLGYRAPEYWNQDRCRGAVESAVARGLHVPQEWSLQGDFDFLQDAVNGLLGERRPDAIVCASDSIAMMVQISAMSRGLRPGTDIVITGFDGLPMPVAMDPPILSVALPIDRIAAELLNLLSRLVDGHPAPATGQIIGTSLTSEHRSLMS